MLHYLLPSLSKYLFHYIFSSIGSSNDVEETFEKIKKTCSLDTDDYFVSQSLAFYLSDIKQNIQMYGDKWDIYKKYTNPHEYIHTTIPYKSNCVAKIKPLSRSFFKMIEIVHDFELVSANNKLIQSFHLAEGPGGFIEALAHIRKNKYDRYYGMTLLKGSSTNDNIPGWRKSRAFLKDNENVYIENGRDRTGNILSLDNFLYVVQKYGSTMDIITADGGFDFSNDFNRQEMHARELIFAQIAYALCMQKYHGCFILKVFDIFTKFTLDMMALLASMYDQVYITKPHTSRIANSEKYIICKGFRFQQKDEFFPYIVSAFKTIVENKDENRHLSLFPESYIPLIFLNKLEEINAIIGQQQIENIHHTITLIHDDSHGTDVFWKYLRPTLCGSGGDVEENRQMLSTTSSEASTRNGSKWKRYKVNEVDSFQDDTSNYKMKSAIHALVKKNIQRCAEWCVKYHIPYEMML